MSLVYCHLLYVYLALRKERYIDGLPACINNCLMIHLDEFSGAISRSSGMEGAFQRHFKLLEIEMADRNLNCICSEYSVKIFRWALYLLHSYKFPKEANERKTSMSKARKAMVNEM